MSGKVRSATFRPEDLEVVPEEPGTVRADAVDDLDGATAVLASGSPPMRVLRHDAQTATVEWEARDGSRQEHTWPRACLRLPGRTMS